MHWLLLFIQWPQNVLGLNVVGGAKGVLPCKSQRLDDIIISRTLVQAEWAEASTSYQHFLNMCELLTSW